MLARPLLGRAPGLGLLGLLACGPKADAPLAESSSESSGAQPPASLDLGSDAVVCGEPGDRAGSDESFAALAGCEVYRGSLSLDHPGPDLSPLASLRILEGALTTTGFNYELETLEGLEQLQSVGEFRFSNDGLRSMSGVRSLREVEGFCYLSGLSSLADLDGLENLRSAGGLEVSFNSMLVDIDGLSGLQRVEGDLRIDGNPELTGVDGLSALEHVTGDLYIRENPKVPLSQIDALLSRVTVDGQVYLELE
mgnify:CR=1 FL=1